MDATTHADARPVDGAPLRSNRPDVRNPLAGDPQVVAIMDELMLEHPAAAEALRATLRRLSAKWRGDAERAWRSSKAPMGRYYRDNAFVARHCAVLLKSAAVNSRHLALLLRAEAAPRPGRASQ